MNRSRASGHLTTWLLCLALNGGAMAQAPDGEGRVRVKVIDGRLVASCRVSSDVASLPVNLFISYDRLCGLELHNKATDPLKVEFPDGRTRPITINLPGLDIEVERREHGDENALNAFTKAFSEELEEVAVVGTIGANVLRDYFVTFDVGNGQVIVRPPNEETETRPTGPEARYVRADATTELVWLPVRLRDEHRRVVAIGSHRYDSIIDADVCDEFEAYGGDIGPVMTAGVDFSELIPWRPEEYTQVHLDGALGTLGINFLENFRVSIDRVNSWVGITRTGNRPFPTEERAFFEARAEEEAAPVAAWLGQHAATRLGKEAADLLLQLQVDDAASIEELGAAIEWVARTRHPRLRATQAIDAVNMLMQARRPQAAVIAGRAGITGGRIDRYPESVHRLHAMLGEILLAADRDREAWEHLMSAAFGLNEAVGEADQARVNLLLGRYYEKIGKPKRALSRYVQAVITPEYGPQAVEALAALQSRSEGEPFSVDLVDRLISGKVRSMTAPTQFVPNEETATNRTVLVEHVINPELGMKAPGMWRAFTEGGSMVFQALQSHFPRQRVVLIGYHAPMPRPVAIMNEVSIAAAARTNGRPAFLIDGEPKLSGALEYYRADGAYDRVRRSVLDRLAVPSGHEIALEASLKDRSVSGSVRVTGPAAGDAIVQVLVAEKGVLYPGMGATVVHRMVARGSLRDDAAYAPGDGGMILRFERSVDDLVAANRAFLESYEKANRVDATRMSLEIAADQLVVIAVLRERGSGRVLQCTEIDLSKKVGR